MIWAIRHSDHTGEDALQALMAPLTAGFDHNAQASGQS